MDKGSNSMITEQYKTRKRLFLIIVVGILLLFSWHQTKIAQEKTIEAKAYEKLLLQKDGQIQQLTIENEQLKGQIRIILTSYKAPILTDEGFNSLVDLLFPPAAAARYKAIVTKCENSSKDPKKFYINTDGSIDLGVSQINSRWHSAKVKKIFAEDFYSAMSDSVKNIVYAALIYKDQQNFSAWSCDRKLARKSNE